MEDWEKRQAREHYEKYRELAALLGVASLRNLLPYRRSPSEWLGKYIEDRHLNQGSLQRWDNMHGPVRSLAMRAGRKGFSNCETVCVLKWVAVYVVAQAEPPPAEWAYLEES